MGTIIVAAIVFGLSTLAVVSMVRDKKNGKSLHCGEDCKHCGGHCGQ
ncbi:MAG: FeoB-associated Cys-rich membrane protein [Clostridiales bacterium]|nr:FeoB-associated Cys-rich membrane protein [Clostridiales bacterium]